jgi:hypothetical protein
LVINEDVIRLYGKRDGDQQCYDPKGDDRLGVLNYRVCQTFEYTHVAHVMMVVIISRISTAV